jgi:predicted kinase
VLILMSGLPGVGKSTIADELGRRLRGAVVSVDPIESAILRSGFTLSFETGLAAYNVGATVAEHQLRLGLDVVADAANHLEVGRAIWLAAAERAGAETRAVEVVCSDDELHRTRLAARRRGLEPYPEPTWESVVVRRAATEPWTRPVVRVDSAAPVDANVEAVLRHLARPEPG